MEEKGFTLIELIVVTTVTLILTGGALAGYSAFNNTQRLKQTALTLKNDIRSTQSKAMSVKKPPGCQKFASYTMSFAQDSYTIRADCEPALADPVVQRIDLPDDIRLTFTSPSVVFAPLNGTVQPFVTLTLTALGSKQYQLDVYVSGDIKETPPT